MRKYGRVGVPAFVYNPVPAFEPGNCEAVIENQVYRVLHLDLDLTNQFKECWYNVENVETGYRTKYAEHCMVAV